jgi:putative transposase
LDIRRLAVFSRGDRFVFKQVMGWSMSSRMKASLVCDALTMAIWQRHPQARLIVDSDQGVQYASKTYRRLIKTHGFIGSMGKRGCCWDNVAAESFFGSLKQERIHWRNYPTRFKAQQDILNYITVWYKRHRLHSYLDYHSPKDFEQTNGKLKIVA